jgi:hypothetical protein
MARKVLEVSTPRSIVKQDRSIHQKNNHSKSRSSLLSVLFRASYLGHSFRIRKADVRASVHAYEGLEFGRFAAGTISGRIGSVKRGSRRCCQVTNIRAPFSLEFSKNSGWLLRSQLREHESLTGSDAITKHDKTP